MQMSLIVSRTEYKLIHLDDKMMQCKVLWAISERVKTKKKYSLSIVLLGVMVISVKKALV